MINSNIQNDILIALKALNIEVALSKVVIETPEDSKNGDFSTNVAMRFASQEKKNPRDFALEVVESLPENIYIEKVEIAGPGFINFYMSSKYLLDILNDVVAKESFQLETKKGKDVLLEYTDPNPFKIFHIGHLYTNCVGESFSRLQEALGANVKRACYQGDVGLHVAKTLWGLGVKMKEEGITFEDIRSKGLVDRVRYLGDAYVFGVNHYDNIKDPVEVQEMDDLNYYLFSLSVSSLEKKDFSKYEVSGIKEMYTEGRDWCLEYFESIYKRLGTKYDYYFFETEVSESGLKVVMDNLGTIFEKDDGAIIYRGDESNGLHTRVFVNKYGIPTYEGKELGLFSAKAEKIEYDESIILTGDEQAGYFKVVLDAFSKINPGLASNTRHMIHGMVKLPGAKKMSSRKGSIVSGEGLLDSLSGAVKGVMLEGKRVSEDRVEEMSEKISVAAMKYAFLKVGVGGDLIYDIDESISFDGNTGPYLLYVYARCKSLLKGTEGVVPIVKESKLDVYSKALISVLSKYEGAVLDSAVNYSPSTLCTYLFDLGKKFNNFYQNVQVLTENEEEKAMLLAIVYATMKIMEDGLNLLGIPVVEEM